MGLLVARVERQEVGQVGHRLVRGGGNGRALEPGLLAKGVQLQDGVKVATRPGDLAGTGRGHASLHEGCDLVL